MPATLAQPMTWPGLLTEVRQRELLGGRPSRTPGSDSRTEFARDYDRLLFATPVRRLQDKAQVFPLEPNDSVRTRLTHSLEVSTIAQQLASNVAQWLRQAGHLEDDRQAQAVQAMAATCGLMHDLGNPPFGHSGETAIQAWFERHACDIVEPISGQRFDELSPQHQHDFLRFEGNAQTIRIVTRLQVLADLHGLNFTTGTLSAACKYIAPSHEADRRDENHARSKPGYFASEADLIARVREATGTGCARHPLTYIVEAADDIVYSIIDLEDGVKKRLLTWDVLREGLLERTRHDETVIRCLDAAERRVSDSPMPLAGHARDEALVGAFRTSVIGETVASAVDTFRARYDDIMNGRFTGELMTEGVAAPIVRACKRIGRQYVYPAEEVVRREIMGQRVIHDLMDIFWNAAAHFEIDWLDQHGRVTSFAFPAKAYSLLSANYRAVFEDALRSGDLPPLYARLQLVTDNIAGMTDTYACSLHRELMSG